MFKKDEIDALNLLEREKQDLQRQLTLQQAQSELIKDYVMRQGTYKIIITIYQVNDLQPKSLKLWKLQLDQKTACDSIVQINVNDKIKRTQIRKGTNNPIFDEQFYFEFQKMSIQELDKAKITFNVYDTKFWGHSESLIGSFQLDWTNVYFKRNHQIYRAWLTLYDPNNQLQGPVGYLLANIAVLGQNDQITVHDSAFIKDPLVTIEDTITSPKLPLIDCSIAIEIYRAQGLVPIDFISSEVKAYVIAKFSGNKVKTSNVTSLNPQWNQCIKIGTQVPNKSKYVTLQIRNKNLFRTDDIIGILKIPFIDIFQQNSKPRWGHLYGPPIAGKDVDPTFYATKMQIYGDKIGSHYRGRLLFKISGKKDTYTKNIKNKLIFKFPFRVMPVIPMKLFILRVDLIEGFGLPDLKFCHVQICMGQYTLKTNKYNINNGFCEFFDMLDDKKMNLPQNLESMPDLIIYLCNGLSEQNRIGFLRIKASQIFNNDPLYDQVKVHELKFDKSINPKQTKGSCGFIACRLHLFNSATSSPSRKKITDKMRIKDEFQFRVFLYRGQNFPPVNEQGDCDPMIKFSFDDKKFESSAVMSTYNPVWNQVISSTVRIQNLFSSNMQKCLICDVYDFEKSKKHNYVGSFSVKINGLMRKKLKLSQKYNSQSIQFIYLKPQWQYVINPNVQVGNCVFGKVLISCAIFKRKYAINGQTIKFVDLEKDCRFNQISTQTLKKNFNFYVIGIRQLNVKREQSIFNAIKKATQKKLTDLMVRPQIRMNNQNDKKNKVALSHIEIKSNKDEIQTQQTDQVQIIGEDGDECFRVKNQGCQVNKVYRFRDIQIPKNKKLSSFAEFKVSDKSGDYVYGYNSVNLKDLVSITDENQGQGKGIQEKKILQVEELTKQLKKVQMLGKIKQERRIQEQTGKYISQKRLKVANEQVLMPPQEIQNRNNPQPDQQEVIEMEKLLKEFEKDFQAQQEGNYGHGQYDYIRQNMTGTSSNYSFLDPSSNEKYSYNSIDHQLKLFKPNKKTLINNQIPEQDHDQEQSFIDHDQNYRKPKKRSNFNDFLKIDQPYQHQGSSKNLMMQGKDQPTNDHIAFNTFNTKPKSILKESKQRNLRKNIQQSEVNLESLQPQQRSEVYKSKKGQTQPKNEGIISTFNLNQSLVLSEKAHPEKVINYKEVQKGLKLQQQHFQEAVQKQHQYKYANAVKLSLFKWMRKAPETKDKQTYQDYDTDEDQNLDIIPQWYKGRKILNNDLENILASNRTIQNIPVFRGRKIEGFQTRVKQKVGIIKMVVLSGDNKSQLQTRAKNYQRLLRQKEYSCRIYVLKGKSLLTRNLQKPNTYLRFTYGEKVTEYKEHLVKNSNNPEYYLSHQEWISLPGPSTIRIEVMEAIYLVGSVGDKLAKDRMIGFTQIDIEDRYFMKKWHLFDRKPIELRNLYSQFGVGTQGRLETWIDLVEKKKWFVQPIIKITPPPWDQYELRVIVWSTKQCAFKNQQLESNDIFVRGQIGKSNYQQTDVHWACRSVGNFNYRFKFPVFYPPKPEDMYSDIFTVQIWDKDVIGFDNLIGEARINLNKMHRIIQKAVKRKKPVAAIKKIIQKNMRSTDKFWFQVFNHKEKDEFGQLQSQGKVQLSFQLVPIQVAKAERANGYGRSEPNVYPTLSQPSGRLNFNLLHPLDFLKQLLGPNMYKSLCIKFFAILVIIILVLIFVFFGTSIVAGLVAKS